MSQPIPESLPPDLEREIALSDNALTVLRKRYLLRGPDGEPVETPAQMFWRVARVVATPDADYGEDALATARTFYDLLTSFRFMPNSPTFTGAGTPLGQLAACFVLPIEDDMGRDPAGIFSTLRVAALVQQTGGGNGFSFSRLRPKGARVSSSRGVATGPVGFLRVYDHAFGEIAQGGCLLPDTLVFTEKGLLRLDEMINPEIPGWQEHTITVLTDEGIKVSPRGFNNGIAEVVRVHTGEGLSLTGTPNHKVKVMTDEGPQWRELDKLKCGDRIIVRLGEHRGRLQVLKQPARQHGNQVMPALPAILDEELAFFLGYLAGDGFVARGKDDHRVGVSVAHTSYLVREMPLLMERLFGVSVHKMQKPGDRSVTFVMDNRAVKELLVMNGLDKQSSREAAVPRLIRQSPANIIGAYLRGLFEADGTLSHGYPALMTTSARLAREVATLLIGLGCPVKLRTVVPGLERWGDSEMYQVRITSTVGLEAWRQKIGCDPRSRFVSAYSWESDLRRECSYILPHPRYWLQPVLEEITLEQVDARGRGRNLHLRATVPKLRRKILRYLRGDRQLTRSGYDLLKAEHPEAFRGAPSPDGLWFVEVLGVEPVGQALTLDLEVDDNHTYLAYGMVTHNTRRGANMAVLRVDHPDILDFIRCKGQEGEIVNFNISVGITDAFMRAVEADEEYDLISPQDGSVWRRLRAREVFDEIVKQAHRNGEPGVLFLDTANRSNPLPQLYNLEATNPCVTGETLIYTESGLYRADELAALGKPLRIVTDGRFGTDILMRASPVLATGVKPVFRLLTREGYEVRLTADHRVMTPKGWMAAKELQPGDRLYLLNRKGGFGIQGALEEGRILGWLVGDGTVNAARAVLSFSSEEKRELAPMFAEAVNKVVGHGQGRAYPVGVTEIHARDEARVSSERLRVWAACYGLMENKFQVPKEVLTGSEAMQRGFLQALFTADGQVNDGGEKGCSVRLSSSHLALLKDVQRLLLNFGIASRIYENRRTDGYRLMPDGHGGKKPYRHQPQHDLAITKTNLIRFADEIGFLTEAKQSRLANYLSRMTRGPYQEPFLATVASVEPDGYEPVYDLQQPETHSFIANGLVVHNCGEQWLGPYENCCLGSVNLARHVTPDGGVDWPKLQATVELATHFLDNVVDANKYVPSVPEIEEAAQRARRIGLGIMGLGDLMYQVGIRYGSPEGEEFAAQVMEFIRYHAMRTSIELAHRRGPFPAIASSIYDPDNLPWRPPAPLSPYTHDFGRPPLDWSQILQGIRAHGIRNAAQTTVAPTGTVSTVSGCEAYGCEPVFALAYIRHFKDGDRDVELTYTSPLFLQALERAGLDEQTCERIIRQVALTGSCQQVREVPEEIRRVFVVANDISAEEHVRMQAAIQAFVDNSISKTINFPEHATPDDVARAYHLAWRLGCKGLTVYVTGSREKVVLETLKTKQSKEKGEEQPLPRKPRPTALRGITYRTPTPLGTAYITINENGEDEPFEVFANVGKAGSDTAAVAEAIGRLISLALRMPSPLTARERLMEVIDQLSGIGGGRPLGFGPNRVRSLPDAIAQVLARHLALVEAEPSAAQLPLPITLPDPKADLCPDCGQASYVAMEGCRKCLNCGYSEC